MRGEVEIYRGSEKIYHADNMIVDGAGKTIADIMTLSRSLSGVEDHATSSILDTSNYTIQAISFGKDKQSFNDYGHKYHPNRRNLLYNSTFSAIVADEDTSVSPTSVDFHVLSSTPQVKNPPGYESTPSSDAHVVLMLDKSDENNVYFINDVNFRNSNFTEVVPSGCQDKWFCYSVYIKPDMENYPFNQNFSTYDDIQSQVEIRFDTLSPTQAGDIGRARNSVVLKFNNETGAVSSIQPASFTTDERDDIAGFAHTYFLGQGGAQDVGDGWYRVWNTIPAPSSCDLLRTAIFPAGFEGTAPVGETSGGIYTFGHQVEVGRWPTPLQLNQGYEATAWDLSGSVLNEWYGKYGSYDLEEIDKGTVRVYVDPSSTYYSSTAYINNYAGESPNPESTRLENDSVQPEIFSNIFSAMEFGQNPNFIPFRDYSSVDFQTRHYNNIFSALGNGTNTVHYVDHLINLYEEDEGKTIQEMFNEFNLSGLGSLGNQAYYLGCYPEGSSTGGSKYALVSGLDSSGPYYQKMTEGTYFGIFNEASSMDNFGFVNMIMSSVGIGQPQVSSTYSGLIITADPTPVNTPPAFLEYSVHLGAGDVGYANLFGGITKMAMWTIDVPESLKAGNTPPFEFRTLNNPRKYRMFCTKHFEKNILYSRDFTPASKGSSNYSDLLIKWRLHFR